MIKSFIAGIKYKFPLCCILAFCLGKSSKGVVMRDNDPYDVWRPCFLHKNTAISNKEHLLIVNKGDISWISERGTFDEKGMYHSL